MRLRKRKQPRRSTVLLFASILLILGIFVTSYNYLVGKKEKIYSSMNLLLYEDETPENIIDDGLDDIGENEENSGNNQTASGVSYSYIGTLEIEKIGLKHGFLDVNSPYNNVDRNITVIKESIFPDKQNANLILVAHSGNCAVCYFDKLYKLTLGDKAVVEYKNKKYSYKLVDIYDVEKTGEVEIRRNPQRSVLTLITCTHNSETKQTVYIFELSKTV